MSKFDNPYAPPESDVAPAPREDRSESLEDAPRGVRLANFLIDLAFRWVLDVALGVAMIAVGVDAKEKVVLYAVTFVTFVLYYVVLEGVCGTERRQAHHGHTCRRARWEIRPASARIPHPDARARSFRSGRIVIRQRRARVASHAWSGTRVVRGRS